MGQMAEGMEGEKETMIRDADLHDLDGLVDIERRSFLTERISRRSFRHLLTRGNARLLVDAEDGNIRAYSLLLFQRGTPLARLYSFAVAPEYRGLGVAKTLLAATEGAALEGGRILVRLEVRSDNEAAIRLYTRSGYRSFGSIEDYYEDHATALQNIFNPRSLVGHELGPRAWNHHVGDHGGGPLTRRRCGLRVLERPLDQLGRRPGIAQPEVMHKRCKQLRRPSARRHMPPGERFELLTDKAHLVRNKRLFDATIPDHVNNQPRDSTAQIRGELRARNERHRRMRSQPRLNAPDALRHSQLTGRELPLKRANVRNRQRDAHRSTRRHSVSGKPGHIAHLTPLRCQLKKWRTGTHDDVGHRATRRHPLQPRQHLRRGGHPTDELPQLLRNPGDHRQHPPPSLAINQTHTRQPRKRELKLPVPSRRQHQVLARRMRLYQRLRDHPPILARTPATGKTDSAQQAVSAAADRTPRLSSRALCPTDRTRHGGARRVKAHA